MSCDLVFSSSKASKAAVLVLSSSKTSKVVVKQVKYSHLAAVKQVKWQCLSELKTRRLNFVLSQVSYIIYNILTHYLYVYCPPFFWILPPPFFDPRIVAPFLIPYLIFYFFSLHCRLHAYSWLFCIFFFHFCSYLNWRLQTQRIQRRKK